MEAVSISNALFSKVQQRVLALIFGHPERSFYTSEILRSVEILIGWPASICCQCRRPKPKEIISSWVYPCFFLSRLIREPSSR